MARITVEDCLEKVENQYDLVLLAKERTVQLNADSPMLVEENNDKRTIISLREIGDGKISTDELEQSAIKRLRKEPDETEELEETEEETIKLFFEVKKTSGPKRITTPKNPKNIPKIVQVVIFSLTTKKYESGKINNATEAIEIPAKAEVTYC